MKVYIKTFGCQMNERDSEWMVGRLLSSGWEIAENPESADLVIINTCSVRKHAEDRAFSFLGRLKKIKKQKPKFKIAFTGCTAQAYGESLIQRFPYIDILLSPSGEKQILNSVEKVFNENSKVVILNTEQEPKDFAHRGDFRKKEFSAFVSIMEGCDNFCSYCIVPYVRGRERSRPLKEIVTEVKCLVEKGYKEVMLLGQNVNSYRLQATGYRLQRNNGFIKLLEEVDKTGIERIRFMTSHPKDASSDLFKAMRDLEHVCEHLHLPLQSGSDKILKLMNRNYTLEKYLRLVEEYRKILPSGSLTTDIIVGFPGEGMEDFEATIKALLKIEFDSAFIFKYSIRPHTPASKLEDDVPKDEKERRNNLALAVQKEISLRRKMKLVGKKLEVLFEEQKNEITLGRSRENFTVEVKEKLPLGKICEVMVEEASMNSLKGKCV
jgi:tRNA-2-methylthio-N6-dimethylallyladenosine synthase